ncbi:MAG TPA: GGDEF domain-containing protein, partial [Burkholderiaceae bacterium]|nr:GGDEF domain-containing protein [Burkholderiaceae bacterium]
MGRRIALTTEAIRLAQKRKDVFAEALGRHNLGIALIHTGQVAQGRHEVETGFKLTIDTGSSTGLDALYEEYGRALHDVGLTQDAVQAYLKERQYRRQLYRDDLRKTVLEAQEALEADRRSREIELLNRDMSLKNEQLRASQLEFRLWLLMGGCVLAAGALLLLAYRRVRRTNMALQSTNERLKVQSERDPLTGLANRRHFQAAIRQREEQDQLRGSVFLIDIDHFKRINDQYGHAAGDTVLVEVSRRLRQALREEDLIVRWGGEEFLIVIKSSDPVFAQHLGQRLLEAIGGQPVTHERHTVPVTASIGFASLPVEPHGVSLHWERAIDMVDTLMYMAKAHGRNKAYGLQWADAPDSDSLLQLAEQMEAAWHDGKVRLSTQAGPAQ